jgi:hypothetical protein
VQQHLDEAFTICMSDLRLFFPHSHTRPRSGLPSPHDSLPHTTIYGTLTSVASANRSVTSPFGCHLPTSLDHWRDAVVTSHSPVHTPRIHGRTLATSWHIAQSLRHGVAQVTVFLWDTFVYWARSLHFFLSYTCSSLFQNSSVWDSFSLFAYLTTHISAFLETLLFFVGRTLWESPGVVPLLPRRSR